MQPPHLVALAAVSLNGIPFLGARALEKRLRDFWARNPDARLPLLRWHQLISKARYHDFSMLRCDFPSADWVGGMVVFNIGGNKYRLVADVRFERALVFVKAVLTHRDYEKGAWKK